MAMEGVSTEASSAMHDQLESSRRKSELPECALANLVVDVLFPTDRCGGPDGFAMGDSPRRQLRRSPRAARGSQSGDDGDPVGTRWECRVVTPVVGLSVDCLSAEGCGVVVCEQPYSLFPIFDCCHVDYPPRYGAWKDDGSFELDESYRTPRLTASDNDGTLSTQARTAPTSLRGVRVTHGEEEEDAAEKSQVTHKTLQPKPGEDNRDKHTQPIRIFFGTWNTEYSEFPAEFIAAQKQQCGRQEERYCKTAQAMQQRLKKDSIRRLSKDETLGQASTTGTETHEFSTWSLAPFEAEESEEDRITVAGEEDDDDAYDADDADGDGADVAPKDKSHLLEGLSEGQQPLRDWLKGGYDIYVVTLQEVTSDNIFQAISFYLESENKEPFLRVDMGEGKISGYGKGAWTKMKSTSMACWIRESKLWPLGPVRPLAYKAFSFTVLNGSKGAITVVLKVHQQLVCFIGCHLPASHKERGKARAFIRSKIAAMYSYEKGVDFTRVFHHIFWAGDFNFRCLISSKKALDMLRAGKLQELQQYDERALEAGKEMEMHRWVEAPITFLPTYKKRDGRPPLDMSKPDWVEGEYQVTMKKKGMLGATKTVDRPPSWCDRITRWSRGELEFNVYSSSDEYFAATPSSRTILMASDHAPVGGGFSLYALDPKFTLPKTFMADPSEQFERAES